MMALFAFGCAVFAAMLGFLFFLDRRRETQQRGSESIHGDWPVVPEVFHPFHDTGSSPDGQ